MLTHTLTQIHPDTHIHRYNHTHTHTHTAVIRNGFTLCLPCFTQAKLQYMKLDWWEYQLLINPGLQYFGSTKEKWNSTSEGWIASVRSLSKETRLAILPRHLGHNWGCMEHFIVRHTRLRLVCVRLSSRHTSLNYSALLAGSRGSRTSIFFYPSAVLSLVGFVQQQHQGWAIEYL